MAIFGQYCILAAIITTSLSLILYFFIWRGRESLRSQARYFFIASGSCIGLALVMLLILILRHDFSVAYVYSYSSTDLPLYYLVASLWGGQEGTFLLWVFFTSVMALVLMRTAKQFEAGTMFFVNLFVFSILVILLKKSPFEFMPVYRAEGAGLNPLLQNFWMTIHPPIMFVGFAASLFPFVFGMTGLIERKYTTWAEQARKWTLFAWLALGVSLVMGGYWAYKTLGWGGFWAWDPVENSSFIPWIFLTSQVHTLFIKRQRKGLMRFSLIAVCMTFWSVLYGTFLTRSGVLGDFSVHSFVDLGINNFLIAGLLFFVGVGFFLLIIRWQDIKPQPSYSKVASRSYLVTLGIVVLFLGGVLTLLGTSAPLLTRMTENPSNVGITYYFATMTPIAIVLLLLLALFPNFKWNQGISEPKLLITGGIIGFVVSIILLVSGVTASIMYLFLFGASASAGFETKKTVILPKAQVVHEMGHTLEFAAVVETPKGFDCHVKVANDNNEFLAVLPHEFPKNQEGVMKKPFVKRYLSYDLYLSPLALEQPESSDPGTVTLSKGNSATVDKYEITFHDFELANNDDGEMAEAFALLTVNYDDKEESLKPSIGLVNNTLESTPSQFDYDKGTVAIAGVHPDDGSVTLKVQGDFLPPSDLQTASLVIELSRKPLINLFWLGTIMIFISGALSM